MKKRMLSALLCLCMMLTMIPAAFAVEDETVDTPVDSGQADTVPNDASSETAGITTQASLEAAIANASAGDTVTLEGDIKVASTIRIIDKSLTLNMSGHKIYNESTVWNQDTDSWSLVSVGSDAELTITGKGTFQTLQDDCYAVDVVDGGSCKIENGTFVGNIHAVYVLQGSLIVNGGTFSVQQKYNDTYPDEYVLNCYDAHYKNGTASIIVNGGSFAGFNPRDCRAEGTGTNFCALGRKVTESTDNNITFYTVVKLNDGQMVVNPVPSEDGSVSASLEGTYTNSTSSVEGSGEGKPSGSVQDNTVSVNLTSDSSESATSASLNMAADTAKSMAGNGAALEVKSNVGTLTVSNDALKTISDNANNEAVTLSIAKADTAEDTGTTSYELTAKTANGTDVFTESVGIIKVSVPAPSGVTQDNVHVYYLGSDGAEKIENAKVEGENVVWEVDHFSTYLVSAEEQKVSVTVNDTTTTYDDLSTALSAISSESDENITVNLLGNVSMTQKFSSSKNITINGNGFTITGDEDNNGVYFEVTGGTFTLDDVTLDKFGPSAGTNSGVAVIKVPDSAVATTKVVANDVNVTNYCRSAYDIRSGSFEITGGTINPGAAVTGENNRLTKGILAGMGSNKVTGTVTDVTITNSASNYDDWNTAGIEVYKNADVTVRGGSITNVENGIHVDNYYSVTGDNVTGAVVKADNVTVSASNDAIRVYGNSTNTNNETASITVNGGSYTGDIAVIKGTTSGGSTASKETVSVNNATVNGTIDNANGVMGFVNSTITNADTDDNSETGVTYVNTKVNGTTVNTAVTGKEAMIGGVQYNTLKEAIEAAKDGDVVTLLSNVTLDGENKGNNTGLLTITKDITIEGNDKTIMAQNVTVDGTNGPSMINIQDGAKVKVKNLTIDGKEVGEGVTDNTKHGLNVYQATVTVENVIIKNGNGYAIVVNGSTATINGLTTSGNGWGGVNVDSKSAAASLTINNANISEDNSVKIENGLSGTNIDPAITITGGTFKYITKGTEITDPNLTISGGTFATAEYDGALDIADYVADGMEWDPATGEVVKESQNQGGNGGGGGGSSSSGYTVSVDSSIDNGSISVSPSRASRGDTVTITVDPDEGYELDILIVTDANGNEIDVERQSDTRYTFIMPSGKVTIDATFTATAETPETPDQIGSFVDVTTADWFADAVQYMLDNGMMNGVTDTTFAPGSTTTRGMIVTILYRLEGEPDTAASSFTDVAANMYYADAVAWAQANSIVTGITETTFAPDQAITREQMAAILYRYAQYKGYDVTANNDLSSYTDASQISAYATTAMQWANAEGLITGNTDTTINPTGNATRAEVATILMRFCENIAK